MKPLFNHLYNHIINYNHSILQQAVFREHKDLALLGFEVTAAAEGARCLAIPLHEATNGLAEMGDRRTKLGRDMQLCMIIFADF